MAAPILFVLMKKHIAKRLNSSHPNPLPTNRPCFATMLCMVPCPSVPGDGTFGKKSKPSRTRGTAVVYIIGLAYSSIHQREPSMI